MIYKYGYVGFRIWFLVDLPDTRLISPSRLVEGIKQKMSEGKDIWEALDSADEVTWTPSTINIEFYCAEGKELRFRKNKYNRATQILEKSKFSIGLKIGEDKIPDGQILYFRNPDEVLKTILKKKIDELPLLEHYAVYKYIRKDTGNLRV